MNWQVAAVEVIHAGKISLEAMSAKDRDDHLLADLTCGHPYLDVGRCSSKMSL
jgi:hypothetical protein